MKPTHMKTAGLLAGIALALALPSASAAESHMTEALTHAEAAAGATDAKAIAEHSESRAINGPSLW